MKKVLFILFVGLLFLFACKKDKSEPLKAFEDVTYADIQKLEAQFSDQKIVVSTATDGNTLEAGSVIFYKTNQGLLGKFKIVSISVQNLLTIDMVNYDAGTGMESLNKPGVTIKASYTCDLDLGTEGIPSTNDFWWFMGNTDQDRSIEPELPAKFYVYSK